VPPLRRKSQHHKPRSHPWRYHLYSNGGGLEGMGGRHRRWLWPLGRRNRHHRPLRPLFLHHLVGNRPRL